jgi:hypothetical protein
MEMKKFVECGIEKNILDNLGFEIIVMIKNETSDEQKEFILRSDLFHA